MVTGPRLTGATQRSPGGCFGGGPDFSLVRWAGAERIVVHPTCADITHSGTTRPTEVFPMEGGDTVVALCLWKEVTRW